MSELPADMIAFKSQQHRWAKGGTEVLQKLLGRLLSARLGFTTKAEAAIHLLSNLSHLIILIDCVFFLIPAIVLRQSILPYPPVWVDAALFCFGGLSHFYFYLSAQANLGQKVWSNLLLVPVLMATTVGISRSNGRGVFDALVGRKSPFVRTPKQGQVTDQTQDQRFTTSYLSKLKVGGQTIECILSLCYLVALVWCARHQIFEATPFLTIFCFGFFFAGSSSLHSRFQTKAIEQPGCAKLGSDA